MPSPLAELRMKPPEEPMTSKSESVGSTDLILTQHQNNLKMLVLGCLFWWCISKMDHEERASELKRALWEQANNTNEGI